MSQQNSLTSSEALSLLVDGNKRFATGMRSLESVLSVSKMKELVTNGQSPFAIVLTCSDSRVPTEMVFDRGLGDLFVIRIAGNVTSPMVIASVEYAESQLGSPLVLVMGHSHCGAVSTAVRAEDDSDVGHKLTPDLSTLISAIRPAVREARTIVGHTCDFNTCVHESIWSNVRRSAKLISESSEVINRLEDQKRLKIVSAVYDLESGVVDFERESTAIHQLRSIAVTKRARV